MNPSRYEIEITPYKNYYFEGIKTKIFDKKEKKYIPIPFEIIDFSYRDRWSLIFKKRIKKNIKEIAQQIELNLYSLLEININKIIKE